MVLKPSPAKPQKLTLSLIFLFLILFPLAMIFCSKPHIIYTHRLSNNHQTTIEDKASLEIQRPKWLEVVVTQIEREKLRIAFVNTANATAAGYKSEAHDPGAELVNVHFQPVDKNVRWKDYFPEQIDESAPSTIQTCPEIPMPRFEDYKDLDVVVARIPCGLMTKNKGFDDIFRLQVHLVVANLLLKSGVTIVEDAYRDMYLVAISSCFPMLEIFRCDDLLWHEGDVRVYRPDLRRLKQKLLMPVGTCQLAPPYAQAGQEVWRGSANHDQPRVAYVTILHSSEAYVCGAMALAHSIIESGSTKDLVLLADESISKDSLSGLSKAGWNVKPIERIKRPYAKINEWNYTKLRIWQLTEYDKVIFIDADIILLRNIDEFFIYPQISAVGNSRHVFDSGVMLIEPSNCTFETLMSESYSVVSYNGSDDQGYLNEVFSWWHRWPSKLNFLKSFQDGQDDRKHEIPEELFAIHYLGIKPWMCYQDYDCNWDVSEFRRFASDTAHARWWQVYKAMPLKLRSYCALTPEMDARIRKARETSSNENSSDEHWKIDVQDPRRNLRKFFPTWM